MRSFCIRLRKLIAGVPLAVLCASGISYALLLWAFPVFVKNTKGFGSAILGRNDKSRTAAYIRKREEEQTFPRTVTNAIDNQIAEVGSALLTYYKTIGKITRLAQVSVKYFKDKSGNYYIQDTRSTITKVSFVYKKSSVSLENITYSQSSNLQCGQLHRPQALPLQQAQLP